MIFLICRLENAISRGWWLPWGGFAALDVAVESGGEFGEDLRFGLGEVVLFLWIVFEVVEFVGLGGIVLEYLPIAADQGVIGFALVLRPTFAADEV